MSFFFHALQPSRAGRDIVPGWQAATGYYGLMRLRNLLLLLTACSATADIRDCVCDLASPSVSETRACSLCLEAEKHPVSEPVFLVRDNDPTKPNRWLAVPRAKFDGINPLARMSADERLVLWTTAIAKAKEVWGETWAVAMNGDISRRQCHAHVHIGQLLVTEEVMETGSFVDGPAQLPAIADGTGIWFHPVNGRLHVHTGEQTTESVLMR